MSANGQIEYAAKPVMQGTTSKPSSMASYINASEERKGVQLQLHSPLGQPQAPPAPLQPQSPT